MNPSATNPQVEDQTPHSAFMLARTEREGFLRHFGFRESPFGVTPDPEFLLWFQSHKAALQALIASIEANLGFSVLLGKPGMGKTTLLFRLLAQYRESARTAFIFQTQCRPRDLIRHVASELELPLTSDEVSLHQKLNGMLLKEARAGRKVLIVIDEAQNLGVPSLEAIRLLSDFETGPSKLLHIVLSGSPRLGETLLTPELSQLAQRISNVSRLEPLTKEEVSDYVRFRLALVAPRAAEGLFSPESLVEIACQSKGVPRIINSICYRALTLAYREGQGVVPGELVKRAARALDLSESTSTDSRTATHLPKPGDVPLWDGVSSPLPLPKTELPRRALTQGFVQTVQVPSVDAKTVAETPHAPACVNDEDVNLEGQPVPAKADQETEIREPAIIGLESAGHHRLRSLELAAAAVVLLAIGSLFAWNELRPKPGTGGTDTSQSQPGPLNPQIQPSTQEVKNGIRHGRLRQPDRFSAPPSIEADADPFAGNQDSASFNLRADPPRQSKITSQSSTPEEQPPPSNIESTSEGFDSLAQLAAAGPPTLPRLEAPKDTSGPQAAFPRPIKIIKPKYPVKAQEWHIEGAVQLEVTIDRNGKVENVRGLSGNPILVEAAEQAVRGWQYSPSTGDESTVPAVTQVQFNFKLSRDASNR